MQACELPGAETVGSGLAVVAEFDAVGDVVGTTGTAAGIDDHVVGDGQARAPQGVHPHDEVSADGHGGIGHDRSELQSLSAQAEAACQVDVAEQHKSRTSIGLSRQNTRGNGPTIGPAVAVFVVDEPEIKAPRRQT